ncbi:MAG: Na-translocating system protein MpsC family protein [Cyanobacteria bacterium P01_H01_bin.21]
MRINSSLEQYSLSQSSSTVGELERCLSQKIQALYGQRLGQSSVSVLCHLFSQELVIILENSTTQVEKYLSSRGASSLSLEVREILDQRLKQEIANLIKSVLCVDVRGMLIDTSIGLGRTGIIAALSETPSVRNPDAVPKTAAYKQARRKKVPRR